MSGNNGAAHADLRAIHTHLATAQATHLSLVAELDRRPEALPHVPPGKTAATIRRIPQHLKTKLIPTDEGDLADGTGEGTGQVRTGAQVIDDLLTEQSQHLSPGTVEILGRQILDRLDPDRHDRYDADAHERRAHTWHRDFAGMGHHQLILDPTNDALVNAALVAHSAPHPAGTASDEHGHQITLPDRRDRRVVRCR